MSSYEFLISAIVPCRNERHTIEPFLEDIFAQQGIPGDWEVIVADGCSDDGTSQVLQGCAANSPRLRVVDNPGKIVSTGLNLAIREARGEFIVRLDVHTRYAPDYIAQCLAVMAETGADNVGGPALTHATGIKQQAIAAAYSSPFSVGNAQFHFAEFEGEVDTVTYGFWRKDTLERLRGFDEQLVRNQDDELNLRIREAGGTIWQSPRIRSWYIPRHRLRDLFQQYFQYGFWKVAVIRKHRKPASLRHLVPGAFLGFLLLCTILAPWSRLAWVAGAVSITAYLLFLLAGSISISVKKGWKVFPLLPLAIATFHFGYGIGFLTGMLGRRFAGRRSNMNRLSR